MKVLYIHILFAYVLSICSLVAQNDIKHYPVIEAHVYHGCLLPHSDDVHTIHNGKAYQGYELRIGLQTTGNKLWHQDFNFPMCGVGMYYGDFNNPIIGHPLALFSYIDIPFYESASFRFSSNLMVGLSFNMNEYDASVAEPNLAIGTDLNAFLALALAGEYPLNSKLKCSLGIKMQHFSNGTVKRPNLGLNLATAEFTLRYSHNGKPPLVAQASYHKPKEWTYSAMYAGGLADIFDDTDYQYYCSTTTFTAHYTLNNKRTIGLGCDGFYRSYLKDDEHIPAGANAMQYMSYGVHLSSEYMIHDLHAYVQVGAYLWRPYAYEIPFYERLGLRYFFLNDRCFANVSVFAHDIRALYTEWGIGFSFRNR